MDFSKTLFFIDSQLTQEDLESLKFLCLDLLPNKKLLALKSNLDLFEELRKHSLLEEDKYELLAELLYIIGQHSLLKHLSTSKLVIQENLKKKRTVSSYREMLFQLYEDTSSEDLRSILFLLRVPKKYEESKKFLDVLCYLEKNDQLSEDNLDVLENAVHNVSPELLRKIIDYKKKREKARSESVSYEEEYDDKMVLSVEAQGAPAEDQERGSITVQFESEPVHYKDLMAENTENLSELSLNQQPKLQIQKYSMNRKRRGYCFIINNEVFMRLDKRPGTEKDAEFLTKVFTWLGLDVEIRTDLSAPDIHKYLLEFSKRNHTERDCFVCCILTHGKSQNVYGIDNESIPISEVTAYFTSKNCTTLAGKPKLFFIQACQGKGSQAAHAIEPDAVSSAEEKRSAITIPNDADVLVGMSTVDGYYSFRDIRKGSWYIQALCENLTKMVPKGEDILSIMTKVNKDVSEMEYLKDGKTNMKQMPQPFYTLRKKLVFPAPFTPFNTSFQEKN
ncbi:hypothetical protein GDO78_023156 [Eleutherodactylus coqui]|uniref:Caspase-8 n=1 Tax=Eleutherodactylus coqui TaxID=57060 RepID=A0A8J6JR81_ELECQ|nr:hypothetical protein GDO78_023156 [Eleutherodactylus coqui]